MGFGCLWTGLGFLGLSWILPTPRRWRPLPRLSSRPAGGILTGSSAGFFIFWGGAADGCLWVIFGQTCLSWWTRSLGCGFMEGVSGIEPAALRMMAANEANWDQRTPIHLASAFYGVDGSREPESWFAEYEWGDLGELAGVDLLHLQ